jgi:ectoine hydroxylase-related dioxygenase (phytanoyl-CoA dioxygenase family)
MLGEGFVYEAFGMLWVYPHAPAQNRHRDGGVLFPESGIDKILPPSAMTVAIPLVDVTEEWAPTGATPGSHRLEPGASAGEMEPIALDRGSAAIWDFRVLHAGLANRTDRPRPALYFTVCRPFWADHLNFRKNARARLIGDPAVIDGLGPRFVRARPFG